MAATKSTPSVIAIDGPAASGKSTLGRLLAERLGYLYFDTGVMYRAVTLAALERRVAVDEEIAISELAEGLDINVEQVPSARVPYRVTIDGVAVTDRLRGPRVDGHVSRVSAYPRVRKAMTERQRAIGRRGQVVMVGRDIGTVVLPEADLKIYLEASVEVRARRRQQEEAQAGERGDYQAILRAMKSRDRYDSSRELAPLRPAADAVHLDTTDLSIDEMLASALALANADGRGE